MPADDSPALAPPADRLVELTVLILAGNEERMLPSLLESLVPLGAARVVVIDSESTDRTPVVALAWGAEVVVHPWEGFRDQRRFGQALASTSWVLWMDADERLTSELVDEIRRVVRAPGSADGYRIKRRGYYLGRPLRILYPDATMRLARRARSRWEGGRVHERMEIEGRTGTLTADMLHDSFRDVLDQHLKRTRYAHLMARSRLDRGRRFRWWMWWRPALVPVKYLGWMGGLLHGRRALIYAASYTIYALQKVIFMAEASYAADVASSDFPMRSADDLPDEPVLCAPSSKGQ